MPFKTHRTSQLLVGPDASHQPLPRVVIGSQQQMANLMGDDPAQHVAWIRPGALRRAGNPVGKDGRERTLVRLAVTERFAERDTTRSIREV